MSPITTITNSEEQHFDLNEKENELSVNPIDTSPPRNNTENDDILSVTMDETGLHQVFLSSEHILLHLDDPIAIESKCQDLWDLGQQLMHLPMDNNIYSKAILWVIYHCRGAIAYHQKEWDNAIRACQTCFSIDLPTQMLESSESLLVQKVALMQSHTSAILEKCLAHQEQQTRRRPSIASDSSSSSYGSIAAVMKVCSFCAVKKRNMPVCAQCKSQRYCSMTCLKSDKEYHSSHCLQR